MRRIEGVIAALAARQHGVVEHPQLIAAGFSGAQVERCIRIGLLGPVHRGIYVVGAGSPLAAECAAVRACRPRALLSHWTAAPLWRMPAGPAEEIHVTVVGRSQRPPKGVRVHHLAGLPGAELRRHQGVPLTSPSLTLLDLAGVLGRDGLLACLHEARMHRLVTDRELHATLVAHPNRRGARVLRKLLASEIGVRVTRSEAERRTLRLLREHGLEPDASDWPIGPYTLDFYFAAERVAVEYDSVAFHDNPKRFFSDRRRIAYLAARGIVTVPLTSHDIGAGAQRAMADLRATLAGRRRAA